MCNPRLNSGCPTAYCAAAMAAGQRTIRLALVRMPRSWACMMPRFTPWLRPKSSAFTIRWRAIMSGALKSSLQHQFSKNFFGVEIFLRDFPGSAAVAWVIALDGVEGSEDVFHGFKREETAPGGQAIAKGGFLGNHGTTCSQVRGAAITEPTAAQADVLIFRHRNLTSGTQDVITITIKIAGDFDRVGPTPSMLVEQALNFFIFAQGQFKRNWAALRQIDDLHELPVLRPVIRLPVVGDIFAFVFPGGDGGVRLALNIKGVRPEIENDGLAGRNPCKPFQWDFAVGRPEIFSVTEMNIMSRQRGDGAFVALGNFDL